MKSVEANEAGETMRVKLAAAEAERDALGREVAVWRAKEEHQHSCEVKSRDRAEKAEAALREARWLAEHWPAFWIVGPRWTDAERYAKAIEAIKALRDTAPAEQCEGCGGTGEIPQGLPCDGPIPCPDCATEPSRGGEAMSKTPLIVKWLDGYEVGKGYCPREVRDAIRAVLAQPE